MGVEYQVDHFGPLPGQFQHPLGRRRSGRQTNGHDLLGILGLQRGRTVITSARSGSITSGALSTHQRGRRDGCYAHAG